MADSHADEEKHINLDPYARPVSGDDLVQLRMEVGASTRDMQWLLAMSATKWSKTISADGPVPNLTTALIARWMINNQDLVPVRPVISPVEFYEVSQAILEAGGVALTEERFCQSLGRSYSALSRWKVTSDEPTADISNLIYYLICELEFLTGWQWPKISDLGYELLNTRKGSQIKKPSSNEDIPDSRVLIDRVAKFWGDWLKIADVERDLRSGYAAG